MFIRLVIDLHLVVSLQVKSLCEVLANLGSAKKNPKRGGSEAPNMPGSKPYHLQVCGSKHLDIWETIAVFLLTLDQNHSIGLFVPDITSTYYFEATSKLNLDPIEL